MVSVQAMTPPLISFIITTHERPIPLLKRCIGSVLAVKAGGAVTEVIVVDDGSKVCPFPLLGEALTRQIVCIRQDNGGLARARNAGMARARGRYIQFVDDDDCLLPRAYDHVAALAQEERYDLIFFRLTRSARALREGAPMMTANAPVEYYSSGAAYMAGHNLRGSACGYLFRRSAAGELRFTLGIYHEDEDFTARLLLQVGPLVDAPFTAYYYQRSRGSIITRRDAATVERRLSDLLGIIIRLRRLAPQGLPSEATALHDGSAAAHDLIRRAVTRRVDQLAMAYVYRVITTTRSLPRLIQALRTLRVEKLYPLPVRPYSRAYQWFCRMANLLAPFV